MLKRQHVCCHKIGEEIKENVAVHCSQETTSSKQAGSHVGSPYIQHVVVGSSAGILLDQSRELIAALFGSGGVVAFISTPALLSLSS